MSRLGYEMDRSLSLHPANYQVERFCLFPIIRPGPERYLRNAMLWN